MGAENRAISVKSPLAESPTCYDSHMNLNADQERRLTDIARTGRRLAKAKRQAADTTEAVKAQVLAAIEDGVPVTRCAEAAGVQPSLVWHWKTRATEARGGTQPGGPAKPKTVMLDVDTGTGRWRHEAI